MDRTYQYAGLHNATQQGFSVDQCAARIHRFAYAAERLMFLQAAHIISTPERDVKVLLARLQYEDSQHASQFKARLTELRVSKTKAYQAPDASLQTVFDEANTRGEYYRTDSRIDKGVQTGAFGCIPKVCQRNQRFGRLSHRAPPKNRSSLK